LVRVAVFEEALRESVERAQRAMLIAQHDDQPFEADRHASRLLDLLDRANANGVDTTNWVPRTVLDAVPASVRGTS
jgi:hypothetical protein